MVEEGKNLYQVIVQKREKEASAVSRIMLVGYLNEQVVHKEKIDVEPWLTESIKKYSGIINGYLLIKGLFYLHMLESNQPEVLNEYMLSLYNVSLKIPGLHNALNILYNSDENPDPFFKSWFCENIFQTGPILSESDKTDQQISDRNFEIYTLLGQGAKKKQNDERVKLANECPINMDDMCMLINKRFMSIQQYHELYLTEVEFRADGEQVFPLRPPILKNLEFLKCEDYQTYTN